MKRLPVIAVLRLRGCLPSYSPKLAVAISFATARSFYILNLLAHLLDQQLEFEARVGEVLRHGLRAERVRFAVQLLHQEVKALAGRPSGLDHAVHFLQVRSQAIELPGDVRLEAEKREFLPDAPLLRVAQ